MIKNTFYLILKARWSCRKNDLIRKMVKHNIYDIPTWLTNNCKAYIARYLTEEKQPENEVWSVNRI